MRSRSFLFAILFVITGQFGFSHCVAQDYTQPQNRIKSIYVYNFIKAIQWPDRSTDVIKICLLDKDPFFVELEKLMATKSIDDKTIVVSQVSSAADCKQCHLLFIDGQQTKDKPAYDQTCGSLVITNGFYESSLSNIVLMFHENKLQFSINSTLCSKSGFKIAPQLMTLANQKIIAP